MHHKCAALLLAFSVSAFPVGLADARVGVLAVENNCGPLRLVALNRCTQDGVIGNGVTQISLRGSFRKDGRVWYCQYDGYDQRGKTVFEVRYNYYANLYFSTVCTSSGGDCTCKPGWGPQ